PMRATIDFPKLPQVPAEVPLYTTIRPEWNQKTVAQLSDGLGVRGAVVDAGTWFVVRDGVSTVEVYQASASVRLSRDDFDAEGRGQSECTIDRDRAIRVAERFHAAMGGISGQASLPTVSDLEVLVARRDERAIQRRVVGLQVSHTYSLDDVPLFGPGAKAQVTVARDGEIAHAYRFWRDAKRTASLPTVPPDQALERFADAGQFVELPRTATVKVASIELGLLCLAPTEVQSVLQPAYVVRGTVSTEMLPNYEFIRYVAAADVNPSDAKRKHWASVRPALLVA